MYRILIKNFYENGVLVKDERLLYSIPIQKGEIDNVVTDPSVSNDIGKTGTMEFTVHPNHPYYHAFAQMRTIMRVEYDGDNIFRGRILTIDNTMAGVKKIHCEGDMAFLLDSIHMESKKESREKISLNKYINEILNNHNQQMLESGEDDKCIYPGYIPGAYPSDIDLVQQIKEKEDTFGSNSTEQSMNALESLTKEFGGFLRTRYSIEDGKTYLDWCRCWFRNDPDNCQPIAITQNIIDAQSNSEVENIFTAVIPIGSKEGEDLFIDNYKTDIHGKNNRILVPQITKVFSEEELATGYATKAVYEKAVEQYGIIYKFQKFPNADTEEKLWNYVCDWIRNNYVGGITSYDLSAIDLHHVDQDIPKYLLGDRIPLTIHSDMTELDEYNSDKRSNTVNRTLLSVRYDLHHPEKNSYTAGISSDILNLEYGTKSTSKSKGGGGGGGAKGGGDDNNNDDDKRKQEAREKASDSLAWKLVWNETYNNKEYEALKKINGGLAIKPVLNTSQLIVKKVVSNPDIDTKEEVYEQVAMVLDGQKNAARLATAALPFSHVVNEVGKKSPTLKKMIEMDEGYQKAVTSLSLNAGVKTLQINGKNSGVVDQIMEQVMDLGITDDMPTDQMTEMIKMVTDNIDLPNTIASFGSHSDENGDESGIIELAKEKVTNFIADAQGNGGSGTINVGKEDTSGKWLIQMNQPLKWKDEHDVEHTLPSGTIDAQDYSLFKQAMNKSIPSFYTQVGVFKDAIAENLNAITVNAESIRALRLDVNSLSSKAITTESLAAGFSVTGTLTAGGLLQVNGGGTLSVNGTFNYHGNTIALKGLTVVVDAETGRTENISYLGTN